MQHGKIPPWTGDVPFEAYREAVQLWTQHTCIRPEARAAVLINRLSGDIRKFARPNGVVRFQEAHGASILMGQLSQELGANPVDTVLSDSDAFFHIRRTEAPADEFFLR